MPEDIAKTGATPPEPESEDKQGQEQYFLEVDDRTRYRTSDDAKKAFGEAGQRIASLSTWEKLGKDWGINTPEELAQLLEKHVELRAAAAKAGEAKGKDAEGRPPELTDEEKKTIKWLQEKAGVVSKADLAELKEMIQSLTQSKEQDAEERFNSIVDEGRAELRSLLRKEGFLTDEKDEKSALRIEAAVRGILEDTPEFLAKFRRGGAAMRAVVQEAFDAYLEGPKAWADRKTAASVGKKTNAMKAGGPLPRGSDDTHVKKTAPEKPKEFSPEVNEEAWDVFQKALGVE